MEETLNELLDAELIGVPATTAKTRVPMALAAMEAYWCIKRRANKAVALAPGWEIKCQTE